MGKNGGRDKVFRCDVASLYEAVSVRPPSVRPSAVRDAFFLGLGERPQAVASDGRVSGLVFFAKPMLLLFFSSDTKPLSAWFSLCLFQFVCVCLCVTLSIRSFCLSLSLTHSLVHSLAHSFAHSFAHSLAHSLAHQPINLSTFKVTYMLRCMQTTRPITRLDCRVLLGRGGNQSGTDRPTDRPTEWLIDRVARDKKLLRLQWKP